MPKQTNIGLDIGSSAVRAAEVVIDGDRRTLHRFAQVGLSPGAVVEGEINDAVEVTSAIKRLWANGGFNSKSVILGMGSQRAMVRQIAMPKMPEAELKEALRFKIGEFLPIPVDQAVVDSAPLPGREEADGGRRVLLVAAQRDVVVAGIAAVEAAGLRVKAVDPSSLALLRATSRGGTANAGGESGLDAVVSIGAELVTVAIREGGVPRFMRTVSLAGPGTSKSAHEAFAGVSGPGDQSRRGSRPLPQVTGVEEEATRLSSIVGEVRSSLEFLLSQSETRQFDEVMLTGGGAMLPGVTQALSSALALPVRAAQPAFSVDRATLGLEPEAVSEAEYRWLTSVGLALWGTDGYGTPSLMPAEVIAKRKERKVMFAAGVGVAVIAASLGLVSVQKLENARHLSSQIVSAQSQSASLQGEINKLSYVTLIPSELTQQRQMATAALEGDINWVGLLHHLSEATPSDVVIESVSLNKTANLSPGGTPSTPGSVVGNIGITGYSSGGPAGIAEFLEKVHKVPGLTALWVAQTTKTTTVVSFTATVDVTTAAFSNRTSSFSGANK